MRFQIRELREAGVQVLDCEHKTPKPAEFGHPYIAIPDIQSGRVSLSNVRRISDSDLQEWTRRTVPSSGDILVTRRGRVGDTAPIPTGLACAIGQNIVLLRSDASAVDQSFLRWATRSPQWWLEVERLLNVGAVFSSLNVKDIARIRVPVPPLDEQRAIAEVLNALDDKIAANTKLTEMTVSLSQQIFNSYLASETSQCVPVASVAMTVLGGTPSRDCPGYWSGGTVPWLNSGKANESLILAPSELITEEALSLSATKLMPAGATLIAITGATLGQVARLGIEACGNQSLIGIWSHEQALNDWLYFAIQNQIPKLLTRSTGAAQQHVNKRDVDSLNIPIISPDQLSKFASTVSPLLECTASNARENILLATTRDTLLPQLMSGKLRVKDAESLLAAAL